MHFIRHYPLRNNPLLRENDDSNDIPISAQDSAYDFEKNVG
jgi:hypothetical protein